MTIEKLMNVFNLINLSGNFVQFKTKANIKHYRGVYSFLGAISKE